MSKADELLKKSFEYLDLLTMMIENETPTINEHMGNIQKYLNRKDKLIVGSEWVCDVECVALTDYGYDYFEKNDCVVINNKEHNLIEFIHTDEWFEEMIFRIPTEQFLACFSPKEEE